MKLYKNKYSIGVYGPLEEGEQLLALCDNAYEFADLMKIEIESARMILSAAYNHRISFIRYYGKCCTLAFIEE